MKIVKTAKTLGGIAILGFTATAIATAVNYVKNKINEQEAEELNNKYHEQQDEKVKQVIQSAMIRGGFWPSEEKEEKPQKLDLKTWLTAEFFGY